MGQFASIPLQALPTHSCGYQDALCPRDVRSSQSQIPKEPVEREEAHSVFRRHEQNLPRQQSFVDSGLA